MNKLSQEGILEELDYSPKGTVIRLLETQKVCVFPMGINLRKIYIICKFHFPPYQASFDRKFYLFHYQYKVAHNLRIGKILYCLVSAPKFYEQEVQAFPAWVKLLLPFYALYVW